MVGHRWSGGLGFWKEKRRDIWTRADGGWRWSLRWVSGALCFWNRIRPSTVVGCVAFHFWPRILTSVRSGPARPGPDVRSAMLDMNVMGLSVLTVDQVSTCPPRGFHQTLGAPVTPVSSTWPSQGRYLCPCHEAWVAWYPFICWESAHQFVTFSWYNQSVCLIFGLIYWNFMSYFPYYKHYMKSNEKYPKNIFNSINIAMAAHDLSLRIFLDILLLISFRLFDTFKDLDLT